MIKINYKQNSEMPLTEAPHAGWLVVWPSSVFRFEVHEQDKSGVFVKFSYNFIKYKINMDKPMNTSGK